MGRAEQVGRSESLDFGSLLREHRVQAGLTQEALAERAGLSVRGITALERGHHQPYRDTAERIAEALGLQGAALKRFLLAARPTPHQLSVGQGVSQGLGPATLASATPSATGSLTVVLAGAQPRATDGMLHNLPSQLTSFIGREREMAEVRRLLGTTRLLTLIGAGGTGKTRLAYQFAEQLLEEQPDAFPDGIHVVALAPIREPELVVSAIARALGIDAQPGRPLLDVLIDQIARRQLLLLLDNFEHLLPAAPQIAELLAASPKLKVLVTSRAALRLRGEQEFVVPALGLPLLDRPLDEALDRAEEASPEAIAEAAAVRLFVERAQAVRSDFELTDGNARVVAEICTRLDGLPLAIELAAARIRVVSPEALLPFLEHRLVVLTGGASDLSPRQRTLRATLAWSYDLLSEEDRLAFRRLAVFVGGFTLDAAEVVLGVKLPGAAVPSALVEDPLDRLDSLVGKSLVQRGDQRGNKANGEPRLGMLETIREFGLEQLAASGEEETIRGRHAGYFAAMAEQAEAVLATNDQGDWLHRLDAELANVRSALAWCEGNDAELGLALVANLEVFWETRGYSVEGQRWLRSLLSVTPPRTPARARALVAYAAFLGFTSEGAYHALEEALAIYRSEGDGRGAARALVNLAWYHKARESYDLSRSMLEEAIPLARESGAVDELAKALLLQAVLEMHRGDVDRAWRLSEESLDLRRRHSSPHRLTECLGTLGNLARLRGDYSRARELFEEGLALLRVSGGAASSRAGFFLGGLGYLARVQGDLIRARALVRKSARIYAKVGHRFYLAGAIMYLGIIAIEEGSAYQGTRLIGASGSLSPGTQGGLDPDEIADRDRCLAAARAALGEEEFARAFAEGQAMTLEEAIEYALRDDEA